MSFIIWMVVLVLPIPVGIFGYCKTKRNFKGIVGAEDYSTIKGLKKGVTIYLIVLAVLCTVVVSRPYMSGKNEYQNEYPVEVIETFEILDIKREKVCVGISHMVGGGRNIDLRDTFTISYVERKNRKLNAFAKNIHPSEIRKCVEVPHDAPSRAEHYKTDKEEYWILYLVPKFMAKLAQ